MIDNSSIETRFFVALLGLLCEFGLGLWGGNCLYDKRRLLGAALIGLGLLLGGSTAHWLAFPEVWVPRDEGCYGCQYRARLVTDVITAERGPTP